MLEEIILLNAAALMFSLFFTSLILLPLKPVLANLESYFSDMIVLPLPIEDIIVGVLSGYYTTAFTITFLSRICGEVAREEDIRRLDEAVGAAMIAGALSMTGGLLLRIAGSRIDILPFLLGILFAGNNNVLLSLIISAISATFGTILRWYIVTFKPDIVIVNFLLFLFSFLVAPLVAFSLAKLFYSKCKKQNPEDPCEEVC